MVLFSQVAEFHDFPELSGKPIRPTIHKTLSCRCFYCFQIMRGDFQVPPIQAPMGDGPVMDHIFRPENTGDQIWGVCVLVFIVGTVLRLFCLRLLGKSI